MKLPLRFSKHSGIWGFIFTSVLVSEYSFTLSTATMLLSRSEDIRTIQFRDMVTYKNNQQALKCPIKRSLSTLSADAGANDTAWGCMRMMYMTGYLS